MPIINEELTLKNLQLRFESDIIYTNICDVLIAINPNKYIADMYTQERIMKNFVSIQSPGYNYFNE